MKKTIYRSEERGYANHGWLEAKHSFSFASWFNPEKMNFGVLRVLNDDRVAPGAGFPTHPHDNMEIITIPLSGVLEHKDSMGNTAQIKTGEVQVMSAGTGVTHSEYNASDSEDLKLFQIWIFPNKRDVEPRYDQQYISSDLSNEWQQIISPDQDATNMWIHQDAWLSMGQVDLGKSLTYKRKGKETGLYLMVIEGEVNVVDENLKKRDAIGIDSADEISIQASMDSKLLLIEVPMKLPQY